MNIPARKDNEPANEWYRRIVKEVGSIGGESLYELLHLVGSELYMTGFHARAVIEGWEKGEAEQ